MSATAPFGASGAEITRVGLGTWAFGGTRWGGQSDADSRATLERALATGVGWIDTAAVYGLGRAETLVGRTLAEIPPGDRPLVFTKCGLTWSDGRVDRLASPRGLRRQCDESLARLRSDRLDLYQLHWPPPDGTATEEMWGAMTELVDAGKVRGIGVTNFDVDALARCEAIRHVDAIGAPLSLLDRDAVRDVVAWAAAHGCAMIAYRVLGGGSLTGAFTLDRVARLPPDDWRADAPEFRAPQLPRTLAAVARLRSVAARIGCSVAELAVAWVLAQDGVTAAVVGARSPRQVDDWTRAGDLRLTSRDLEEVEAAFA